jgi:hypothetical protein
MRWMAPSVIERSRETMMADRIFPIFFGVWILLGIAGFWLFYVSRNVAFKRKYFPWYVGLAGVLFVSFGAVMGLPFLAVAIMVPFVALITYMNLRATQFCGACGRTVIQQMPFSRSEFCSKCGAPLGGRSGGSSRG